jgi:DNA-binding response OmpR family regulator
MMDRHGKTVLVIEDDALVRLCLSRMLEHDGHRVLLAANGAEGLKLIDREPVDLVLCDIIMPGMEGTEVIGELRRRHCTAKIIAMSGGSHAAGTDFVGAALQVGADRALAKPFGLGELIAVLRECLDPAPAPAQSSAP